MNEALSHRIVVCFHLLLLIWCASGLLFAHGFCSAGPHSACVATWLYPTYTHAVYVIVCCMGGQASVSWGKQHELHETNSAPLQPYGLGKYIPILS